MRIRWNNVFLALIVLGAVVILARWRPDVGLFFRRLPGPTHNSTSEDRVFNLAALGMLCISVVGLAKLIIRRDR